MFDVSPSELARRTLEIVLLDYDRYSQDECVGQVHCPLDQLAALPPNERVTLWKGFTAYEKKSEVDQRGDVKPCTPHVCQSATCLKNVRLLFFE